MTLPRYTERHEVLLCRFTIGLVYPRDCFTTFTKLGRSRSRWHSMPLFLANSWHVPVPLEPTYQATWDASPEDYRTAVETGVMPEPDAE